MVRNKLSLSDTVGFCTKSSGEENGVHVEDNNSYVDLNATVWGGQNKQRELSDEDVKENETVANVNRLFHRRLNKYTALSIHLLMTPMMIWLISITWRKR